MKKSFLTGLVILLPLAVTVAIVVFIVNFLTTPFVGAVSHFLMKFDIFHQEVFFMKPEHLIKYGSKILILICLFLFTLILGGVARWFFFRSLINLSDKLLHKIPLINKVYKTTQEIIKTLFSQEKNSFQQVVMVPYPKNDSYVIGLVSRESPHSCSEHVGEKMYSVLVPTTPNPTTGFLLMYRESDIIKLDMKTEEAIKYIVSCGMITPEHPEQEGPKQLK